jgi:7,8-dihydro-6-hydroxymethylpterin-pyrophosphokinase
LEVCLSIEAQAGRGVPPRGSTEAAQDASILIFVLFGEETFSDGELEIPHPRALRRNFVLHRFSMSWKAVGSGKAKRVFKC